MSVNLGHILTVFFLVLLLAGCGDEPAQQPQVKPTRAKVSKVKKVVKQKPVTKEKTPKPKYSYNPSGQRDPFVPLLRLRQPVGQRSTVPLTPLQKFELSQFRLVGILVGKGEPRAMVQAPGGKSFILKRGVKIGKNNGTVMAIDPESVKVEEKYYDFTGAVRVNMKEIIIPPRQGVK